VARDFGVTIVGNTAACRTEAEIYIPRDSGELIALVYETQKGWVVEQVEGAPAVKSLTLQEAAESAKQLLGEYVNRTGKGAPTGVTGPGLSLWLMEKADGTSMGRRVR
jgi:hypothetical protein